MDCDETFFHIVNNTIAFGSLILTAVAGAVAFFVYRKQGEQLGLAKRANDLLEVEHARLIKGFEEEDRARSPNFAPTQKSETTKDGIFYTLAREVIDASKVINAWSVDNLIALNFYESDVSSRVHVLLRNLQGSVKIVNVRAFSAPGSDSLEVEFSLFAVTRRDFVDENLFILAYDLPSQKLAESVPLMIRVIFETSSGVVGSHLYRSVGGKAVFQRVDPPDFETLVDRMTSGSNL